MRLKPKLKTRKIRFILDTFPNSSEQTCLPTLNLFRPVVLLNSSIKSLNVAFFTSLDEGVQETAFHGGREARILFGVELHGSDGCHVVL